jgi:hypothetical protein
MAFPQESVTWECPGPLVVHEDGVLECLDPDCTGMDPDRSGLEHDSLETSCWTVFEGDCPRCGPPPEDEPVRTSGAFARGRLSLVAGE